jgi:4-hydroxyphenylpyruvate dioxygenase
MTDTIARGAANQAGAIVNKNAYDEAQDFLPLKGIDHVEFWVGNARQSAHYFRALWGFTPIAYAGLETGVRDRTSYVMRRNDITFVLTGALSPDGEIAEHVHRHGDGVKDIAFLVDDAASSFAETTKRGARPAIEPVELDGGEDGILRRSAVYTYGEVRHSFIDRNDYHGVFAPGFRKVKKPAAAATGLSLLEIDHCVGNVALGDMNRFVDYYRDVFGFAQLIHYDDKVIHTEYSALMSKVMTNGNGRVKFPINEPASGKKKSQIQEFLDYYLDAGTQHIALRTEDIVGTVRTLRGLGVEFLGMPHAYYEQLGARVGDVGVPIETHEEHGIEADRDEEGYLLQIFTRPIQDRPTFFFEIIERHGSRGFGVGNFKALFEAIEIEREALHDRQRLGEERLELGGGHGPDEDHDDPAAGGIEQDHPAARLREVHVRRVVGAGRAGARPVRVEPDVELLSGQAADRDIGQPGDRESVVGTCGGNHLGRRVPGVVLDRLADEPRAAKRSHFDGLGGAPGAHQRRLVCRRVREHREDVGRVVIVDPALRHPEGEGGQEGLGRVTARGQDPGSLPVAGRGPPGREGGAGRCRGAG